MKDVMTLQDLRMKIHRLGDQIESALAGRSWRQLPEAELERLDPILESLDEAMAQEAEVAQRGEGAHVMVGDGDTATRGEYTMDSLHQPGNSKTMTGIKSRGYDSNR